MGAEIHRLTGYPANNRAVARCKIDGVYAEESVLNESGKIDYHTLKPVLFEMPTYEYFRAGGVIGKCMNLDK